MRSRLIAVLVSIVVVLGFAAGLARPAAASPPTPSVTQTVLPLPDAFTVPNVIFDAMSCGAPGSCVAVGQYQDSQGHQTGLIETLSGGGWTGAKAPLPADASASPNPLVLEVACGSAASCVAVETYTSTSAPFTRYALLSLSGGSWAAADFPVLPGTLPVPTGVACNAANSCTVVGSYTGTDNLPRAFVAMFHSGWTVVTPTLPVDAIDPATAFGTLSHLAAVSCSSSRCLAVGHYLKTGSLNEVLVEAITPSSGTVNPDPKPTVPANDDHGTDLTRISCAAAGPCAATGSYQDSGGTAYALLEPLGDGWVHPWAPTAAPTLVAGQPSSTIVTGIGCSTDASDDGCVLAGDYTDSSFNPQVLTDRLVGGVWSADSPPSTLVMGTASCGAPTYCVEAYTGSGGHADDVDVLVGSTWTTVSTVDPVGSPYDVTLEASACDAPDSCWVVGRSYQELAVAEHVTPSAPPPSVTQSTPTSPFTLAASTKVAWTGTAGGSPITRYAVQQRKAAWNGGFGAWTTPAAWSNLSPSTTQVTASLAAGTDTCFRVEAFDSDGGTAYSGQRCTARPLDDVSLAASSGWARVKASGYYLGTYSSSTHLHTTLTRTGAQLDRVALVATRCPTCGKVGVYAGATLLGTVDLHAAATKRQVLVVLAPVSQRTGTVTIKVLTSGKPVQVDGLGISRA